MTHGGATISALMVVRNGAATIGAALDSVLAQSRPVDQVVVVDDGSTDVTRDIVAAYATEDERIELHANSRAPGIPGARNSGLAAVRGDLVMVCDSDDISDPRRAEILADYLEEHPRAGAVGAMISCFHDDPASGVIPSWRWGLRHARPAFPFPTAMFRADAARQVGGFNEGFARAEDVEFAYRLEAAGWELTMLPDVLVHYRVDSDGLPHRAPNESRDTLKAQARGLVLRRGLMSPTGYAILGQSFVRATREQLRQRRRFSTATAR